MHIIETEALIKNENNLVLIDVRSEGEFIQGHIPNAISIPLLNNEERKLVGTCYKEKGNEAAVLLGYELVGGKFALLIRKIKKVAPTKEVMIHCWRGGLRSRIVGQLLENAGFKVFILYGGYKTFRHWALKMNDTDLPLHVIGGLTGSGKTELLHLLYQQGEQIIDLEGLAHHKGSAFGGISQLPQPTQEQFENNLAYIIKDIDSSRTLWIEDESRKIGSICLPLKIWEKMREEKLFEIEVNYEDRLKRILNEYAVLPIEKLEEKTLTLRKRLGDKHLNEIITFLNENKMIEWAGALLNYYDKNYIYGQSKRTSILRQKIILNNGLDVNDFLSKIQKCKKQKGAKAPQ